MWAATALWLGPCHQARGVGGAELKVRAAGPERQVVCEGI